MKVGVINGIDNKINKLCVIAKRNISNQVKGQGQGPKMWSKLKNYPKLVKFGIKRKGLTNAI